MINGNDESRMTTKRTTCVKSINECDFRLYSIDDTCCNNNDINMHWEYDPVNVTQRLLHHVGCMFFRYAAPRLVHSPRSCKRTCLVCSKKRYFLRKIIAIVVSIRFRTFCFRRPFYVLGTSLQFSPINRRPVYFQYCCGVLMPFIPSPSIEYRQDIHLNSCYSCCSVMLFFFSFLVLIFNRASCKH